MSDLISRQAALSAVGFAMADSPSITREDWNAIFDALGGVPSAQPDRKKGKWKIEEPNIVELSYGTTAYEPVYRCSVCERVTESYLRYEEPIMPEDADFPSFCPNCGADMRGE